MLHISNKTKRALNEMTQEREQTFICKLLVTGLITMLSVVFARHFDSDTSVNIKTEL